MKYHAVQKNVHVPHDISIVGEDRVQVIKTREEMCDVVLDNNNTIVAVIRGQQLTNKILECLNKLT